MMVMDGTSAGATTLTRWYKGKNIPMGEIVIGGVRPHSAESAIWSTCLLNVRTSDFLLADIRVRTSSCTLMVHLNHMAW
ncbi:hypothetical protein WQ57_01770 [Mesobacillus campisalis]|uniref:Uncharacterized protein n=1 Tax=Mesobacillus campisalis TaxID=1408103 RepID=A0A0M2T5C4_9BACI|nr:hypothetical protein WQ57_01770 [Mesobacillus campisalis]